MADERVESAAAAAEAGSGVDDLLRRLDQGKQVLIDLMESFPAELYDVQQAAGETVRRFIERTVDDLNFYYGRLVARALSLPQPPCLATADLLSLREAILAVQIAHRRFGTLLHDLAEDDLERPANDPEHGTYTMRQIVELATAQYGLRHQQVARVADAPRSGV